MKRHFYQLRTANRHMTYEVLEYKTKLVMTFSVSEPLPGDPDQEAQNQWLREVHDRWMFDPRKKIPRFVTLYL